MHPGYCPDYEDVMNLRKTQTSNIFTFAGRPELERPAISSTQLLTDPLNAYSLAFAAASPVRSSEGLGIHAQITEFLAQQYASAYEA